MLKNLSYSLPVYFRGLEYYQQKRVRFLEEGSSESCRSVFFQVKGSGKNTYSVVLAFGQDGSFQRASCDCPAPKDKGLCKHAVAALFSLMEEEEEPDPFSPRALQKKNAASRVFTDPAALQLMREYTRRAAQALPGGEKASLEASLIPGQPFRLSFKIGSNKMYVLRDLGKFCEAMRSGEEHAYGKSFTFVHTVENFREESRPLLRFLMGRSTAEFTYSYSGVRRFLSLTPAALDEFLGICASSNGGRVRVEDEDGVKEYPILTEDPKIPLSLQKRRNGLLHLYLAEPVILLRGLDALYILWKEGVYLCSAAFRTACEGLLAALCRNPRGLNFSEEDATAFYSSVLREAASYLPVHSRTDLSAYAPPPMRASLYLDQPREGTVTARLRFFYGDKEYPGFLPREDAFSRDVRKETLLEDTIRRYFPPPDPDTGLLVLHNEDELFRLVDEGMERISPMAELYVTDALRGVKVRSRPAASVGVRVSGGLLELNFSLEGAEEELSQVLASYRAAKKYHRLRDGSFLNLDDEAVGEISELSDALNLTAKQLAQGSAVVPEYRALYLDALFRESSRIQYDRDNAFRRIVRDVRGSADADFEPPAALRGVLRHYQEAGYRWLRTVALYGFGGILADDMGLGKTVQVLALLLSCKKEGSISLVVCPSSLILNWAGEAARFTPELRAVPVLGAASEREALLKEAKEADLLITSYDLLKRDIVLYQDFSFEFEILDEAQYIKNPSTQNAKAAKSVKSRVRFALTGTPVENSLADLWSIFDYLMPGYLYSYGKFRKTLEAPIVREGQTAASERLHRLLGPFILRRLKKDVLRELPEKLETVLTAQMTEEQNKIYLATAAAARDSLLSKEENKLALLAELTKLRQICCDPSLLYENYAGGSGKLELCMELVQSCAESGHKLLLFSQFTSMLAILASRLEEMGLEYYRIVGSTPAAERLELVDAFNRDDTPVFLISLKAGGTGLNLTGADVVIHYDPWWNLSAQNQATDRAHRIGQQNRVQVYELIVKDSIEEKIRQMQEEKARLSENVLQEGGGFLSEMSPEEILALFQ